MSETNKQWNQRMVRWSDKELIGVVRHLVRDVTEGPLVLAKTPSVTYEAFDLLTEDAGAPALERVLPDDAPFHAQARELVLLLADRLEQAIKR